MSDDIFQGYKGQALKVLQKFHARVWGKCKIDTSRGLFEGTILPRSESDDNNHIVLKIASGYNIGINIDTIKNIKELDYKLTVTLI